MRLAFAAMALILLVIAMPAHAQTYFMTNGELLKQCKAEDQFSQGACIGYILGEIDALEGERYQRKKPSCLADHMTRAQIKDWVVSALKAGTAYPPAEPASVSIWLIHQKNCATSN